VLAYDLHYPQHDPRAWACVLDYVRRNRVDGFLFGGDQLDLKSVVIEIQRGLCSATGPHVEAP
jgi:hypothetical protein